MCILSKFYPLVELENGDRKLLFSHGILPTSQEELKQIREMKESLNWSRYGLSPLTSDNIFFKKNHFRKVVKMVSIPCGQCSECLKATSRSWAYRILKEASLYENNYFITLTYDDNHVPCDNNLVKDEISKFNKKLKTYLNRKGCKSDFRFYAVGEYGSHTLRPHYHVIYFNLDIPDLTFDYMAPGHNPIFKSKFLSDLWSKGFITIGSVDVGSACYVARYCDKKKRLTKEEKVNIKASGVVPEFSVCSNKPGIAAQYLDDIVESIKNGESHDFIKGQQYSKLFSPYYTKKVKDLLDPESLRAYEKESIRKMNFKVINQLTIYDYMTPADVIADDDYKIKHKKRGIL